MCAAASRSSAIAPSPRMQKALRVSGGQVNLESPVTACAVGAVVSAVYGVSQLSETNNALSTAGGSRAWAISQLALAAVLGAVARSGSTSTATAVVQAVLLPTLLSLAHLWNHFNKDFSSNERKVTVAVQVALAGLFIYTGFLSNGFDKRI